MKPLTLLRCGALTLAFAGTIAAEIHNPGNTRFESFRTAKKVLQYEVFTPGTKTLYCQASFDEKKRITTPPGFITPGYQNRLKTFEFEHIVPAENFGRHFKEWREGAPACRGEKGRKCAIIASKAFRLMHADLYGLYPAIGSVNALRSNYNFAAQVEKEGAFTFGSCEMIINPKERKAVPPPHARGLIARTYLYFDLNYPQYSLSKQQRRLMEAWHKTYPPTPFECDRAERIAEIQGNVNVFSQQACQTQRTQ